MPFAQLVIGPPGSGKSTYCNGMQQFMSAIGRKCSIVNLDPANDQTSYTPAVDVRELVTLEEIMKEDALGPNGAVLYALEELEENFEWLEEGLHNLGVVVHLVDSYNLTLPSMYISALLLSLRAMLQMDLPHLNVLTKIDNLSKYPSLPFNLDFYTEVHDLSHLIPHLNEEAPWLANSKFDALNSAIVELVQDFGLVGFETLAVEDKKSMMSLLHAIDRAGGYAFGSAEGANDTVWQVAVREGMGVMDVKDVQERWLDAKDEWDEKERQDWEAEARLNSTGPAGDNDDMDMDMDELMSNVPPNNGIKVVRKPPK
ncbi:GPN-loop GTPase 2 [Trichophyton interdigitale]|nr:GPN-loop GTPase 2 [Trichophyton interdigitale]KAG5218610.1 GPN-loop GTPase 2 [Trichophyton interdigitale]KAG8207152.1 GPN-loop GTPase 2 [Trichophyton interdigitale]